MHVCCKQSSICIDNWVGVLARQCEVLVPALIHEVLLFRPVAGIFKRGATCVSDVNICMHKHARLGESGSILSQGNYRN